MKHIKELKKVLRIYIDNTDTFNGEALWKYILNKANEHKLAGATVYKAVAGVGSHNTIHTFDIFNLSAKMPIVIEIIEEQDSIDSFLNSLEGALKEAFVTIHSVETIKYKA